MNYRSEDQPTDRFARVNRNTSSGDAEKSKINKELHQQKLEEAILLMESREMAAAIKLLQEILQEDPDNMVAYEKLQLASSVQSDLNSIAEFVMVGKDCIQHDDWKGAYEEFKAVLTLDPDHEEAKALLEQVMHHLDRDDVESPAEKALDESDEFFLEGEDDGEQLDIGEIMDRAESALEDADSDEEMEIQSISEQHMEYAEDSGDEIENELHTALSLYESGELNAAREALTKLSERYKDHAQIKYYLNIINQKLDQEKTSRNQANAEQLFKSGMDSMEREDYSEAIKNFEEAIAVKSGFEQAQLMLEKAKALKSPQKATKSSSAKTRAARTSTKPKPAKSKAPARRKGVFQYVFMAFAVVLVLIISYFFMVKYPKIQVNNHLQQALQYMESEDYQEALVELEAVKRIDGSIADAWEMDANANFALGRSQKAAASYRKALELMPGKSYLILKLGDAYAQEMKFSDAEKQYERVSNDPAMKVEALYKLGTVQAEQKKTEAAIDSFQKAIAANSEYALAHYELARLLEDKDAPEIAEQAYLTAIEKDSKLTAAYADLGRFYLDLEKPEAAIEILTQPLLWEKPNSPAKVKIVKKLRMLLGRAYYETKEFEEAANEFNRVIMISEDSDAFQEVAKTYYRMGQYQQAIAAWSKSLEKNPDDAETYFSIGATFYKMQDFESALERFQKAVALNPNHAKAWANIGVIYFKQYRYSEAVDAWRRSLAIDPDQPQVVKLMEEANTKR